MPGKSSHGKGKHHLSKKSKAKQRQAVMASQPPATTDIPHKAAVPSTPPLQSAPASAKRLKTAQYPYITNELRSIGILAGIILVILVVLALVLS